MNNTQAAHNQRAANSKHTTTIKHATQQSKNARKAITTKQQYLNAFQACTKETKRMQQISQNKQQACTSFYNSSNNKQHTRNKQATTNHKQAQHKYTTFEASFRSWPNNPKTYIYMCIHKHTYTYSHIGTYMPIHIFFIVRIFETICV